MFKLSRDMKIFLLAWIGPALFIVANILSYIGKEFPSEKIRWTMEMPDGSIAVYGYNLAFKEATIFDIEIFFPIMIVVGFTLLVLFYYKIEEIEKKEMKR